MKTQCSVTFQWCNFSCRSCWTRGAPLPHSKFTNHALVASQSIGRNDLLIRFLKGARRLNPPHSLTIPTWDLSTVLRALRGLPLELSQVAAPLIKDCPPAGPSISQASGRPASVSCLEFGPNDCRVVLKPRHSHVRKEAYESVGLQCPIGVRAQGSSLSTFGRFYNLDVPALPAGVPSV